jgi:hypothetical protein
MVSMTYIIDHIILFDESVRRKLKDRNEGLPDVRKVSAEYFCFGGINDPRHLDNPNIKYHIHCSYFYIFVL